MKICAGDWIEVRSKAEILATLDKNGRLEGMPFMPQMFQYCGQRFQVYKRAHKTCDTVNGPYTGYKAVKLPHGVHLNLRCDGKAYDGCQAACLIFWKEAWLKPLERKFDVKASGSEIGQRGTLTDAGGCTEKDVINATRALNQEANKPLRYTCQATELVAYTQPLKWWDPRQYVEDYRSGNTSTGQIFSTFFYFTYLRATFAQKPKLGYPARWLYDQFQLLRGGNPFPRHKGTLPLGQIGPISDLNLKPGELVRVKSYQEILASINQHNINRGMSFDGEMVPYCGKVYRVLTRIEKFIDEKTGTMKKLKTPTVILEGVFCRSLYSDRRLFCPRSIFSWWREVWLERVSGETEKITEIE